jgi:hypothetical protein
MKLRKIKLICSKLGYEVNIEKTIETYVMDNFGNLLPKQTTLISGDPRGNWMFKPTGKNKYSEFVLEETTEWVNKTPSEVSDSIKAMSPEIIQKYGANVSYVTLEEALMAFLKQMKPYIRLGEFAVVCTPEVVSVVKLLVDNGWPLSRVENKELLSAPVKATAPSDDPAEDLDEPTEIGTPEIDAAVTVTSRQVKTSPKAKEAAKKAKLALGIGKGEPIAA